MEREQHVNLAKLADQAERYDEVVDAMKQACEMNGYLTGDERNLLSVGYKNMIAKRRASWRILSLIEQKEQSNINESNLKLIQDYRIKIEQELTNICNDIIELVEKYLQPAVNTAENSVFYHKMKGDYYRYIAEFKTDLEKKIAAEESMKCYQIASDMATNDLAPTNSIRLGLALNYSVFYYEILKNIEKACHLAKIAFDEAMSEIDTLSEDSYKDSTLIMQLLRDNLTLWACELPEDADVVLGNIADEAREIKTIADRSAVPEAESKED